MAARPPHRTVSGVTQCCPLRVHFMTLSRAFHSGARDAAVVEQTRAALVSIAAINWQETEAPCRFCGPRTLLAVCHLLQHLRTHTVLAPALAHAVVALNRDDWVEMVGEARYEKFTYVWKECSINGFVAGYTCALEWLTLPDIPVTDPVAVALILDALANRIQRYLVSNLSVTHLERVLAVMRRHAHAAVVQAAGNIALWRIIEAGLQLTYENRQDRPSWDNSCGEVVGHILDAVRRHPVAPVERHALGVLSVYGTESGGTLTRATAQRLCEWLGQYLRVCAFVPELTEVVDALRMIGRSFQEWKSVEAVEMLWQAFSACFAYYRRPECGPQDLAQMDPSFWHMTALAGRGLLFDSPTEAAHFQTLLTNDPNVMPLLVSCLALEQESAFQAICELAIVPELRRAAHTFGVGVVLVRALQSYVNDDDSSKPTLGGLSNAIYLYANDEATRQQVIEAGGLEACMDRLEGPTITDGLTSHLRMCFFGLINPRSVLDPEMPDYETTHWDRALPFARTYICAHDRRLLWPWFEAALRYDEGDGTREPESERGIDYAADNSLCAIARSLFDTW